MECKPTDVTILFVYCWISTSFGPTGPSWGEFVQLFTQPLVQFLCHSVRVLCTRTQRHRNWTNGCVNSCTNSPHDDGPVGPKHVEIQQYTNKIVTSVGLHSICWKYARYKGLKFTKNIYNVSLHKNRCIDIIYFRIWRFILFFIAPFGFHILVLYLK